MDFKENIILLTIFNSYLFAKFTLLYKLLAVTTSILTQAKTKFSWSINIDVIQQLLISKGQSYILDIHCP